jgi:hypothetical protein
MVTAYTKRSRRIPSHRRPRSVAARVRLAWRVGRPVEVGCLAGRAWRGGEGLEEVGWRAYGSEVAGGSRLARGGLPRV